MRLVCLRAEKPARLRHSVPVPTSTSPKDRVFCFKSGSRISDATRLMITNMSCKYAVAQHHIASALRDTLEEAGLEVVGNFTTHSVQRVMHENYVAALLQLGQELKECESKYNVC